MSFAEAIKTCFKKYADFGGRAPRPEFWWFVLFYYLVILLPVVPLIAIDASSVNHAHSRNPVRRQRALSSEFSSGWRFSRS